MKSSGIIRAGLVLISVVTGVQCITGSPPVKVSLRTSWPSPPFLLELIETISMEEPDAFFPLLDALTDPDAFPGKEEVSHEVQQQRALNTALSVGYLSKPGALEIVRAHLGLHSATPKIVAFYQHYLEKNGVRPASNETERCGSWVEWYGGVICEVDELIRVAGSATLDPARSSFSKPGPKPEMFPFDHIHPPPDRRLVSPQRTAILHASLQSSNFRELHSHLLSLSSGPAPTVQYIFRPIPPKGSANEKSYLSGYGVTLDLKKMDYLALDDRLTHRKYFSTEDVREMRAKNEDTTPDLVLTLLEQYPLNTTLSITDPLTSYEIAQIGTLATQLVSESNTPLETLRQLVQDFPRYATSLSRHVVPQSGLLQEIASNSRKIQPGVSAVWLNGAQLSSHDMNPYSLLRLVRKERDLMLSLTSLGLVPDEAFNLITHPSLGISSNNDVVEDLLDASDRPEGGNLVFWWNDIEKDSRYARWQPSLYVLLRPMYPGQAPTVRRNMYNVVLVLDLARPSSFHFISSTLSKLIDHSYPVRFGIVPIVETEEGLKMAKIFYYLTQNYGRQQTMRFFNSVLRGTEKQLDWSHIQTEFEALLANEGITDGGEAMPFENVLGSAADDVETKLLKARTYAERLSTTTTSSPEGHVFINGKYHVLDDNFLNKLQLAIGQALQYFQENVYSGVITDDHADDIENHFYDLPTTIKRRNRHIVPVGNGDVRIASLPELYQWAGLNTSLDMFVYSASGQVPLSIYVIADLDSDDGLGTLQAALAFSGSTSTRSRLSFLHNPVLPSKDPGQHARVSLLFSHLVYKGLLSKASPSNLLQFIDILSQPNRPGQMLQDMPYYFDEITGGIALADLDEDVYRRYVQSSRLVAEKVGLVPGATGLIINGRIVGPIASGEFTAEDYQTLQDYELVKRVQPVLNAFEDVVPGLASKDRAVVADVISMLSSIVSGLHVEDPSQSGIFNKAPVSRNRNYQSMNSQYTAFSIGDMTTALHRFAVILDPLSEQAQKYTSLFEWLSHFSTVAIEFHLQPSQYAELPLKRFYRYNLGPFLTFNATGHELASQVSFCNLPVDPIYTLGLDEPSSWLVRPREARYDLDNIQLGVSSGEEQQRDVEVVYELDYIIVGGHARESGTNTPPRGVQLQLTTGHGKPIDDTLVVENLGYLQFKATPGVYRLDIREGHSRDVFELESAGDEGWQSPTVDEVGNRITITSFEGVTLYPRLARLPGRENVDVLEVPKEGVPQGVVNGILSRISSVLKSVGKTEETVLAHENAEINIFTVASGLLYERFASIMILSVLRNTKRTVKFWFIENFLSPSFLEFIPHFAEEYGFQYELVTYKWPTWLRSQREKQRIIWAYKILFLDVLFPMNLDKVIFVDADQIVRTDLKELIDLDLHGAPYGYAPMGDDNKEMEGFRFWKTGYWEQFLRGRPYHISALYVVDLVRFRQMAAGDILRSHYQQLSADPNSLANLDQDLPNNLQGHVPIYSLHEDWLWCETWCSKERLHRAKTIDLCQNPLTKEPKLARARQIPEWEEYDSEIAHFTRRLAEEGRIHASAAAADVNELAKAGFVHSPAEFQDTRVSEVESSHEHLRDEL